MKQVLRGAGALLLLAGMYLFQYAPNGINARSVAFFSVPVAGLLLFFSADALVSGQAAGKNLRKMLAVIFYVLIGAAGFVITVIGLLDGLRAYAAGGILALAASAFMLHRVSREDISSLSVSIASAIGFELIEEDSDYDARGRVNGVEAAFNLDVNDTASGSRRRSGPAYALEVACAVQNQGGFRLCVYPGGLLRRPLKPLPAIVSLPPAHWDNYALHCEPGIPDREAFSRLRKDAASTVFSDKYGFLGMELEGQLLKGRFTGLAGDSADTSAGSETGRSLDAGYVKEVLDGMARAAAIFN